MTPLSNALLAVLIVSSASLIGVSTLFFNKKFLSKVSSILIALATGTLLGAAFFDLLPESIELIDPITTFSYVLAGILVFFLIEKLLFWYHCHNGDCEGHTVAYMNLIGDGMHNMIDGMIIATSFIISAPLGLITTFAITLHELPQEIGDFFVLVYSGLSRNRALFYNFLSAITSFIGVFLVFILAKTTNITTFLTPFAAGGFIYIATADLIPELHKEMNFKKTILQLTLLLAGILMIRKITGMF